MLNQHSLCNDDLNPVFCISSCDGSISFPNHAAIDFENLANFQRSVQLGIQIVQSQWSASSQECKDEIVWPAFRWKKILQYHDKYNPTSAEFLPNNLQNLPSEVGFAKLSDNEINAIDPFDGYNYYKIAQEIYYNDDALIPKGNNAESFFFLRTQKNFVDTQLSFGWGENYETCHSESIRFCKWQPCNGLSDLNHFNAVDGIFHNSWTVDQDGSISCPGIDENQRCFSYGLRWIPIVNIAGAYTPTRKAVGDMSKVIRNIKAGFAKVSDAEINSIKKLVSFAEVTSGSPTIGISSLSISECKLYADSNSFFKWGSEVYAPIGNYGFIGCYRYSNNHGAYPNQVYYSTKTSGSYSCTLDKICVSMNIQNFNGLHYYKFIDMQSIYQPVLFLRTSTEYDDTKGGM